MLTFSVDELFLYIPALCGMGVGSSSHPASAGRVCLSARQSDPCGHKTETIREASLEAVPLVCIDPPIVFPAVIAAGIIWANPITNPTVPHQAIEAGRRCLDVLMYASFASGIWWVWRMRGFRWFAVSLMLLAEVLVFCGLFISGMSVAGDWL